MNYSYIFLVWVLYYVGFYAMGAPIIASQYGAGGL